ncbi:hypothetical protein [Actinomadura vinacea]|uniref:hypothetical protein n=1 Tax=Actinomadura vinacea TaxID=115336 RepID=UPI0031D76677
MADWQTRKSLGDQHGHRYVALRTLPVYRVWSPSSATADGVCSNVSPSGPMTCAVVPAKPSMPRISPGLTC